MMDPSKSFETPWVLKRTEIDENLVQLNLEETSEVTLSKDYLERQVLKSKCERDLNVDRYVLSTSKCTKVVQFYIQTHRPGKFTYLTAQDFTLGLQCVGKGMKHVIKNLAQSSSLYLFLCIGDKSQRYASLTDGRKALINKTWIMSDFQLKPVRPTEIVCLPANSVYFLFTASHSKFKVEHEYKRERCTPEAKDFGVGSLDISLACAKQDVKCKQLEETNSNLMSKVGKMDKELNYLTEKVDEQERTILELRAKNRSMDIELSMLKRKSKTYEKVMDRDIKRKKLTNPE